MEYRKKIEELRDKLKDDPLLLKTVEGIVEDCGRYIKRVHDTEVAYTIARFRMETKEYTKYYEELDRNRKITHDALISGVRLLNRLCMLNDLPPIFEGTEDRVSVADFAKEVVDEFYETRKI